jgi:hypothetical protein
VEQPLLARCGNAADQLNRDWPQRDFILKIGVHRGSINRSHAPRAARLLQPDSEYRGTGAFTLSNALGTDGTNTAVGQFANIGGGGSVAIVAGSPTRWLTSPNFGISSNIITLETISGGQPSQMILPSGGSFTNANASITHGMFNVFVVGPETLRWLS